MRNSVLGAFEKIHDGGEPIDASLLNLHLYVPWRDVRRMIYACMSVVDKKMIRMAHDHRKEQRVVEDKDLCWQIAWEGRLELLVWAREKGCSWNAETCHRAAWAGHLRILTWARANGCPWDERTCCDAAFAGHFEVLRWARENGCPWDVWTCVFATSNGYLNILQWAWANSCPWDEGICENAAHNGCLEVLKWARKIGCPWEFHSVREVARLEGHPHVVGWMDANCDEVDGKNV
jgi:hypothetical protein